MYAMVHDMRETHRQLDTRSHQKPSSELWQRLTAATSIGGVALALTACGPNTPSTTASSHESAAASATAAGQSPAAPSVAGFLLKPDMSGFLKPGTNTCHNGGDRPCGLVLREKPMLESDPVNVANLQSFVSWPREAFGNHPADWLTAECDVPNGGKDSSYEDNLTSTVWFRVIVPESQVGNPTILKKLDAGDPSVPIRHLPDGQLATIAYAAAPWFHSEDAPADMPTC